MNSERWKLIVDGLLLVATLVSGVALTRAGRPLNPALFNLHKLTAVATIVFAAIITRALFVRGAEAGPLELTVLLCAGFSFLALLVSGALLTFDLALPALVLRVHQVAPVVSSAAAVAALLLLGRQTA